MLLINDNCATAMEYLIRDGIKIDAIICDPPYGTTKCKWDTIIPVNIMWDLLESLRKPKTPVVLFGTEPFSSILRTSNLKNFKYDWIWDKVTARGHLVAKKRPMQQTEIISVFYTHNYYPVMVSRPKDKIEYRKTTEYRKTELMGVSNSKAPTNKIYDVWYPKNIIRISNAASSVKSKHPTQKPVELMEYLIKTYTKPGNLVLDFTMGVGSTGVACRNMNRDFIGIELDINYFEIAERRLNGT